ncbi:MAG: hypothetical protein PVJ40_09310 [Gammaproteobacteria bacterium]
MNLRIGANSLRLRLTDAEFDMLRAGKPITEHLHFGDANRLSVHILRATEPELAFQAGTISVALDDAALNAIAAPANRRQGASIPTPTGWPALQVQIDIRKSGRH